MKFNWINDVPVNILQWYTYYSTHQNYKKRKTIVFDKINFSFETGKKTLASWYFANQLGIVWGTISENKKIYILSTKMSTKEIYSKNKQVHKLENIVSFCNYAKKTMII